MARIFNSLVGLIGLAVMIAAFIMAQDIRPTSNRMVFFAQLLVPGATFVAGTMIFGLAVLGALLVDIRNRLRDRG